MRNIIIDFLNDADHGTGTGYAAAETFIRRLNQSIQRCNTAASVYELLNTINTDTEPVIVTFLAHGNVEWLGMWVGTEHHVLLFNRLLPATSRRKTVYPLYLNLLACCQSFGIAKYADNSTRIKELWVTTSDVEDMRKALMAAEENGFDILYETYGDDEEFCNYRLIDIN